MVSNRRFLANIFVPLDLQLILDGCNRQFLRSPLAPVAASPATSLRRLKAGQEGDPSSREALLRMTANGGLGCRTMRLGEADHSSWRVGNFGGASRSVKCGAGCCGKAVAEPPHSKMGWARFSVRTLRETLRVRAARFARWSGAFAPRLKPRVWWLGDWLALRWNFLVGG
jgi:hypothetical protein